MGVSRLRGHLLYQEVDEDHGAPLDGRMDHEEAAAHMARFVANWRTVKAAREAAASPVDRADPCASDRERLASLGQRFDEIAADWVKQMGRVRVLTGTLVLVKDALAKGDPERAMKIANETLSPRREKP